jgi:hypothetical protein
MTTSAKVGLLDCSHSSTATRSSCCGDRDSEYCGNRSGTSMTSPCRRSTSITPTPRPRVPKPIELWAARKKMVAA